jgi:hypothetical protein
MAPRPPLVWIRGGLFLLVAIVLGALSGEPLPSWLTTRLPLSRSRAVARLVMSLVGAAEDHTVVFWPSTMTRRPPGASFRTPGTLTSGALRLATHTTVWPGPGMLVYQMPRYVLPPGGLKKPRVKTPPSETSVWLPVMDVVRSMVSVVATEGEKKLLAATTMAMRRQSARAPMFSTERVARQGDLFSQDMALCGRRPSES